jgi:hypothetical protein
MRAVTYFFRIPFLFTAEKQRVESLPGAEQSLVLWCSGGE